MGSDFCVICIYLIVRVWRDKICNYFADLVWNFRGEGEERAWTVVCDPFARRGAKGWGTESGLAP